MELPYDQADPASIQQFGERLLDKNLRKVPGVIQIPEEYLQTKIGSTSRGTFGNLLERYYYGINPGNDSAPDFPEAGVELKSTPLKRLAKGGYSAKERLVLGLINYKTEGESKDFESSSFFRKNARIMLVSYEDDKARSTVDHPIRITQLLEFSKLPEKDQLIIRNDWVRIVTKIRNNKAHELSEGDTDYLGACTKAADSSITREQPDGSLAKPRAYSFKAGYMTVLLRQMLSPEKAANEYVSAITNVDILKESSFEDEIVSRFTPYIGKSYKEIAHNFSLKTEAKDKFALAARRIMGVSGRKIEEFEKAEITMKSIQLTKSGRPKEAISFPYFRFNQLLEEKWDADIDDERRSKLHTNLEKRFFFVIWRCAKSCEKDEERILERAFFWNMPTNDVSIAKIMWERTVTAVIANDPSGFPKESEHQIIHVRPHGRNSNDTDRLPDGTPYTKQGFWLNHDYIRQIIS